MIWGQFIPMTSKTKYNYLIFQEHWHKIEEAWDAELDSIQRELPKEKGENQEETISGSKAPSKSLLPN
jgi:hypothetical protein